MPGIRTVRGTFPLCAAALLVLSGCGESLDAKKKSPAPRPVSVIELKEVEPPSRLRLTGSAEPWKDENISFEVAGRVKWVIEEGRQVQGRLFDHRNRQLTEGDVLARIDDTRYTLNLRTAEAKVAASEAQAAAVKIEVDQVLEAKLAAAKAEVERARRDLERLKDLRKKDAASDVEFYRTEAAYKVAVANANQIEASIAAKRAELNAINMQTEQAREAVAAAKKDVADCVLVAPFNGQVAKVHVIPGAFVQPGQPVVTLVMMDPFNVELSLSPEQDRQLGDREAVDVHPPGRQETINGVVWNRETIADPATRTFKVSLLVRNRKLPTTMPADPNALALPRITEVWPIVREHSNDPNSGIGTEVDAIYQEEPGGKHFVWHVQNLHRNQRRVDTSPVLKLKKVYVEVFDKVLPLVGLYYFQFLKDAGGLKLEHDLVAAGVPEEFQDGGKVLYVQERWLFRPGDMVDVEIAEKGAVAGLYVPMSAIVARDDRHGHVFLVEDQRAVRVEVKLADRAAEFRRIEPARPEDRARLAPGARLIHQGVHYVVPNERVRVVEKESVEL